MPNSLHVVLNEDDTVQARCRFCPDWIAPIYTDGIKSWNAAAKDATKHEQDVHPEHHARAAKANGATR